MDRKLDRNNDSVFKVSLIIIFLIIVYGIFFSESFEHMTTVLNNIISVNFGWVYTISMTVFLAFSIWIGYFSRFKDIKLGKEDEKPEYTFFSWFAMLFSAGMGVGLIFWGVAEPANYYLNPLGAIPLTTEAAVFTFNKSFLHCTHGHPMP